MEPSSQMTDVTPPRPTGHIGDDPVEIDRLLALIPKHFGENWLKQQVDRALGALWARRDGLASSQLVILGYALDWAENTHPKWLKSQINLPDGTRFEAVVDIRRSGR